MPGFLREHSWPVAASVFLHLLLVAGFVLMTYTVREKRLATVQPLPIDAVVVESQTLQAAQRAVADRAQQEIARAVAEAKAKAEADDQARAAEEAKANAAAEAKAEDLAQADKAAEQQKAAQVQRSAEEKAAAAAKEAARRALEARQAAEVKQAAEARQAAEAKQAADAKRAADERAKQDREAELRRQLADEERLSAVQSGPLRDRYITLLRNSIQNAWIKPASAVAGIDCLVEVTQVPGGAVTGARVKQCNGDAAVRQSIENAVYRASPLPDPPDPALFERNLVLRFRPNE